VELRLSPPNLSSFAVLASCRRAWAGLGVTASDLDLLAAEAAEQWTGRFNPRDWSTAGAREVYQLAL
jgi:alcohol dehydrogenase class IV